MYANAYMHSLCVENRNKGNGGKYFKTFNFYIPTAAKVLHL
jgi:hypothetical protein